MHIMIFQKMSNGREVNFFKTDIYPLKMNLYVHIYMITLFKYDIMLSSTHNEHILQIIIIT